jgi:hypothetical protein
VGVELVIAGLIVGILVGATGMGAGSLMAPLLITVFSVPALSVVGTDLLYSGASKAVGAWRHHTLDTVNTQLAWWMASGSIPASLVGIAVLHRLAVSEGATIQNDVRYGIGVALLAVAAAVAIRTFVTVRGLWDARSLPADGDLTRRHRLIAVVIGVVFGFVFGLTSVGAGAFFGMALILLFPLSARRVVGTDLYHGALVTIPAAVASYFLLPHLELLNVFYLMLGSTPGILVGSQIAATVPERALRGSLATVLAVSALKTLGAF